MLLLDLQEPYSFSPYLHLPDLHLPKLQGGFGKTEGEESKAGRSTLPLVTLSE